MPGMVDGKLVALTEEEFYRDQRFIEYSNLIEGRWKDFDWFGRLIDAIRAKQITLSSRNSDLIMTAGFRPPNMPMDSVVLFGVNIPRNIATLMPDFMLNTPPTIRIRKGQGPEDPAAMEKATAELADRLNSIRLWSVLWECMVDVSGYGGGFLKLIPERMGTVGNVAVNATGVEVGYGSRVKPTVLSPRIVFPKLNPVNKKQADEMEIRFPFTYQDVDYLYVECHKPETIEITAYRFLKKNRDIQNPLLYMHENNQLDPVPQPQVLLAALSIMPGIVPNPLFEYRDLLIDPFLIQHIPNFRAGDSYYGFSDFQGHEGAFDEIFHRMSMLSRGQDLTDDPKANADEEAFQRMPDGGVVFQMGGARVFPRGKGGEGVTPIIWDQKITEKWAGIEKLILRVLAASEIALDLVAPDLATGGADSDIAMQMRLTPTLSKRDRLRRYLDEALNDVLKKIILLDRPLKLRGEQPVANTSTRGNVPAGFSFLWNASPVKDRNADVDYWRKRVASGLSTHVEAIMALDGISEKEAIARVAAIIAEQEEFLPAGLKAGFTDTELDDPTDAKPGE